MANFIRFWDAVDFKAPDISQEIKDAHIIEDKAVKPLTVSIAATHSGKITRNNGFYLPDKMMAGASSFTEQYNKPIQVHHQDTTDPIGRVISARYVDISSGFLARDSFKDSASQLEDEFSKFVSGEMSFEDAYHFANKYVIQNINVVDDPDYEGLGYIEILANITDPDAIQKILDKRYLTGSVGASTNKAVCSVCKTDWAKTGPCKHRPGKLYKKDDVQTKCVLIAGNLKYEEYSFVNRPADRHSQIIEVNVNGVRDFISPDDPDVYLVADLNIQSQEEGNMTFKDAFQLVSGVEKYSVIENLQDKVAIIVKDNEVNTEEDLFALMDKELPEEETITEEEVTVEDQVKEFFGDSYEEIVGEDPEGTQYAEMLFTLLDGVEDEEKLAELKQEIEDAKLTAEGRKKLPDSVFCGPDRSFPVNDCAHAKSAMAYAKKYNKDSSIIDCIKRKAVRLGCPFKDEVQEEQIVEEPKYTLDYFDRYENNDLIDLFDGVMAALTERKITYTDNSKELEEKLQALKEELENLKKGKSEKDNEEAAALKDRVSNLTKEIRYLHTDIDNLTDQLANGVEDATSVRLEMLTYLRQLAGEEVTNDSVIEEFKDKTIDEVKEAIKDTANKVDMQKIIDTLNSGLSNTPNQKVDNPTLVQDNIKTEKTKPDGKLRNEIQTQWMAIRATQGKTIADQWLDKLCEDYNIDLDIDQED